MELRKKLKKAAKKSLKKHYLIFVVICLVASFIGSEFIDSLKVTRIERPQIKLVFSPNKNFKNIMETPNIKKVNEKTIVYNKSRKKTNKVIEYKRGAFASIINSFNSGSFSVLILKGLNTIFHSENITYIFFILGFLILYFLFWYYIINTYKVVSRRLFLEGRIYKSVPIQRFGFLFKIKKWNKASKSMFITSLFKLLWFPTIIGWIIKRYSYYMVPYIVAENPDIPSLKAITISKQMMKNHKWECFKLEMSFILWELLGIITFSISKLLYSNPYKIATFSEYYKELRENYLRNNKEAEILLNDKYLYIKASQEELNDTYQDIITETNFKNTISLTGIKGFLAKNFGISLYNKEDHDKIDKEQIIVAKKSIFKKILNGNCYPTRLSPLKEKKKKYRIDSINYLRIYSITSLIILFFLFSIIGWIYEVSLHLIKTGEIVNRGSLYGPWLPIYGGGSILILTLLYRFRKKPLYLFLSAILVCGLVEYFTSVYLEVVYHKKWWDYSGYFINLNGRICAEGLLVFGLGGFTIVYAIAPYIDNYLRKLKKEMLIIICSIFISFYTIDQVFSIKNPNTGKGVTSYKQVT